MNKKHNDETTTVAACPPLSEGLGVCQWNMDKDFDLHDGAPDLCGKPVKFRSPMGTLVCGTHRRTIDCNNEKFHRPERCVPLTPNIQANSAGEACPTEPKAE
jgi:hypothetical protein